MAPEPTEEPICEHFQQAAELIGKRWTTMIIRGLQSGDSRFSDLRTGIPAISDAVLSDRLKELEVAGIVTRTVSQERPVRIDYLLTARGQDLTKVVEELARWAERWAETPEPV
jgi:DNA-binding HxlR family transcriptional regulator